MVIYWSSYSSYLCIKMGFFNRFLFILKPKSRTDLWFLFWYCVVLYMKILVSLWIKIIRGLVYWNISIIVVKKTTVPFFLHQIHRHDQACITSSFLKWLYTCIATLQLQHAYYSKCSLKIICVLCPNTFAVYLHFS